MNFIQLHTNLKKVINNFDKIVDTVIHEYEAELIDLNTGQLEKGIAPDGIEIEPPYAFDEYARFKKSIGSKAPLGIPDLKLTGDFYSRFETKITPNYIEISSGDSKAPELENKYGEDQIYGLTESNKKEFVQLIKEPLKIIIQYGLTG